MGVFSNTLTSGFAFWRRKNGVDDENVSSRDFDRYLANEMDH
jgi:hypothetical protein